jgi:hypothetical protein
MNISHLNHLEVVAEETNVEGGYYGYTPYAGAYAGSGANAVAYGFSTSSFTETITNTFAQAGYVSASGSYSYSRADSSVPYYY